MQVAVAICQARAIKSKFQDLSRKQTQYLAVSRTVDGLTRQSYYEENIMIQRSERSLDLKDLMNEWIAKTENLVNELRYSKNNLPQEELDLFEKFLKRLDAAQYSAVMTTAEISDFYIPEYDDD